MKKIKRMLALALAVVMTMAMSTVAFADENDQTTTTTKGSIKVTGLAAKDAETVKIYKIATASNKGNWDLSDWVTSDMYTKNEAKDSNNKVTNYTYEFKWSDMKTDVEREEFHIAADETKTCAAESTEVTFTNLDGAAYLILATGGNTTYSVMGATPYKYDENTGAYTGTLAEVYAKTSDIVTTKTADDHVVYAGEKVTFTITTVLPDTKTWNETKKEYEDTTFTVYDKPEHLTNLTLVSTKIGDTAQDGISLTAPTGTETAYSINLTTLVTKDNAGKTVTLTLTGIVEGSNGYTNQAWSNKTETNTDGTPKVPDGGKVTGYTGSITLAKMNGDEKALTGATFNISYKSSITDGVLDTTNNTHPTELYFVAQNAETDGTAVYMLSDNSATGASRDVTVGANGKVKLTGLDEGVYSITETEAPEGYAINPDIADVTLNYGEGKTDATVDANIAESANVVDSTLTSLPFTGGMGTTLFTVLGVAIMVVAAALYFASKKKNNNK